MAELHDQITAELGHLYRIERELGGGGMARVFLADELALDRKVVIKVLAPKLAAEISTERFSREMKIAAGLQDPHIVPVLTSGTIGGDDGAKRIPYYTMPFVAGESLRHRMRREPRPGISECTRILRDILRALSAAHDAGIVHRDIKPENILLTRNGDAVVTDFGIAKAITASQATPDEDRDDGHDGNELTRKGTAIGTPSYMAPEQFVMEGVDNRADLYAWGVIAYELLSGRHPFVGRKNQLELARAHLMEAPAPLDAREIAAPKELIAAIEKCLAKDPSNRPADARAVLAMIETSTPQPALPAFAPTISNEATTLFDNSPRRRRIVFFAAIPIVAMVIVAAVAAAVRARDRVEFGSPSTNKRIALAIFSNQTGDSSLNSLGMMANDFIMRGLSESGAIDVVLLPPPTPGKTQDIRDAARKEGASAILMGAIYRVGDSLRFDPTLMRADGRLLGDIETVATPKSDPAGGLDLLRDRVAGAIAAYVDDHFDPDEVIGDPPSFDIYRLMLDARAEVARGKLSSARKLFQRAAQADTTFIPPLLEELAVMQEDRDPPRADSLIAWLNVRRDRLSIYEAADLDQLQASIHRNLPESYAAARRRLALSPKSATQQNSLAWAALEVNRINEAASLYAAIDTSRLGEDPEPYWTGRAYALHRLGQFDQELAVLNTGMRLLPDNPRLESARIRALAALGKDDDIRDRLSELIVRPRSSSDAGMFAAAASEELIHGNNAWRWSAEGLLRWYQSAPPQMRVSQLSPDLPVVRLVIPILSLLGRNKEAATLSDSMVRSFEPLLKPGVTRDFAISALGMRGVIAGRQGDSATMKRVRQRLTDLRPSAVAQSAVFISLAAIDAQSGRLPSAVEMLRQAVAAGATFRAVSAANSGILLGSTFSVESVWWTPLRKMPEFVALTRPVQ